MKGNIMESALISVIVPVYNVEQYLEKCIQSIIHQTYRNLQIILVDDGSTDDSGKICDVFQAMDQRIQVIHKSNAGLVSARKTGIELAEGEYIANIDSDDWIEQDMLENLYSAAQESGAEVVCSGHYVDMNVSTKVVRNRLKQGTYRLEDVRTEILYSGSFYECSITPYIWSKLFRRDIVKKKQCLVDEQICFGEDLAVGIPAMLSAKKIHISDYVGYHYVQRNNSIIHQKDKCEMNRNLSLLSHLKECLEKEEDSDILLKQLNQYAKNLFLLRQLWWFDEQQDMLLVPYGGIPYGSRVIIYGAGTLGKSIYQYLTETRKAEIIGWHDREFEAYEREGYPVKSPEDLKMQEGDCDYIVISAIGESVAKSITRDLIAMGAPKQKIRWLSDKFVNERMDWEKELKHDYRTGKK